MTAAAPVSHALVLAAGLGTRLRPLTAVRAKPAVPVAGEPIIRRIIHWLVANGVPNVTVNLHHLPESITTLLGDGSDLGASVRYSWEQPVVLGSAGGPRQALDIVGADTFFLLNGDTLTDLDLRALAASHLATRALVTMALMPNVEPTRYGGVKLMADGRVIGFAARGSAAIGSLHFIGAQVVHRSVFENLPPYQPINSVGGCYDQLIAERPSAIRGYLAHAGFWDVGSISDYWNTCWDWSDGDVIAGKQLHIAASARVTRSILWDHVHIGDDAILDECIVTDGVRVESGSRYQRKILMRVPDGSTLTEPLELG